MHGDYLRAWVLDFAKQNLSTPTLSTEARAVEAHLILVSLISVRTVLASAHSIFCVKTQNFRLSFNKIQNIGIYSLRVGRVGREMAGGKGDAPRGK